MSPKRRPKAIRPAKIISGGQTGVDRAALDVAIESGIAHGGWCPRGRLAEDGRIPDRYQLVEIDTPDYPARTTRNVLDSDATLVLCRGRPSGGTELTQRVAERYGKPCLVVDLEQPGDLRAVRRWLLEFGTGTLNVAGPRQSQTPDVAAQAVEFLRKVLGVGG